VRRLLRENWHEMRFSETQLARPHQIENLTRRLKRFEYREIFIGGLCVTPQKSPLMYAHKKSPMLDEKYRRIFKTPQVLMGLSPFPL
jgi:hypothetical protein